MHRSLVCSPIAVVALLALIACTTARSNETERTLASSETAPTVADTPSPTPRDLSFFTTLPASAIVLQYDYEPTFWEPIAMEPRGRVPPFTLFADGTVIYMNPASPPERNAPQVVRAQLSATETQQLVQQVLDLGFERLEDQNGRCQPLPNSKQMCVMDSAYTILRVRLEGELRQVKNYADVANDPAVLISIRAFLASYRHPAAQAYTPEQLALFVQRVGKTVDPLYQWPLDGKILAPPSFAHGDSWMIVLTGTERDAVLATTRRNVGDVYVQHKRQFYRVTLVPWLPGANYANSITAP